MAAVVPSNAVNQPEPAVSDLESGVSHSDTEAFTGRAPLRRVQETTLAEKASAGVAVGAVGTSVTAMLIEQTNIVYGAGILSSLIAPYSVYQQTRLTDIAMLKETHKRLEAEVDHLSEENQRLKKNVAKLGQTVERLEDCEEALSIITNTQSQTVSAFAEQVKENRKVLKEMKKNLKANVLQNLLSVIIRSDVDGSFSIDEEEIENLIRRMNNINGVQVHEDRFRNAIQQSGGNLHDVIGVVKNLLRDDMPNDEQIFVVEDPTEKK